MKSLICIFLFFFFFFFFFLIPYRNARNLNLRHFSINCVAVARKKNFFTAALFFNVARLRAVFARGAILVATGDPRHEACMISRSVLSRGIVVLEGCRVLEFQRTWRISGFD